MDKQSQIQSFDRFVEKQREVMLSKGDDYANQDRLSNFKSAAYICGLTPAQHCLAMIATKVARLGVLLDPKAVTPRNESIQDSILDLGWENGWNEQKASLFWEIIKYEIPGTYSKSGSASNQTFRRKIMYNQHEYMVVHHLDSGD